MWLPIYLTLFWHTYYTLCLLGNHQITFRFLSSIFRIRSFHYLYIRNFENARKHHSKHVSVEMHKRWLWRLLPSGMWRRVVLYIITDTSEEPAASIFRVYSRYRSTTFLRDVSSHIPDYTESHNTLIIKTDNDKIAFCIAIPHKKNFHWK
jgi:hypothetical protein